MNKFSKLFLAVAASTMMLSSCSSEEPAPGNQVTEGGVYATLTLSLPQGSKSSTVDPGTDVPSASTDGTEVGNESENNVGSVLVVIAEKDGSDYSYIASNLADAHQASSSTVAMPTYNVQFETRDLYEKAGAEVYVFAYCNPSTALVEAAKNKFADADGFINRTGNVTNSPVSVKNGFFMSNALLTTVKLPSTTEMDNLYNTPTNPFNLGIVKVERAAVRFDFKETTIGNYDANLYPIYNHSNSDLNEDGTVTTGEPVAFVQLDGMALLNEAVNYYYLPRVSADGTDTDMSLCGQELTTNYVVSPGFTQKIANTLDASWLKANYNFNALNAAGSALVFEGAESNLVYDAIGTSLGEDNPEYKEEGYNIWKYTTENTIPALTLNGVKNYQRIGITTGVVFRGVLKANGTESDLAKTIIDGTSVIYGYNGILYGSLAMLKKAVVANPVSTLAETFKEQFNVTNVEDADEMAAVVSDLTSTVEGGLTIYRPAADKKCYMYYTYLNRHNDNGNNTVMFPMEFSTVRNNVYKLAVTNILEFGHPGDPKDDPDPENPEDPDETPKTYFRVQVKVLPWVVRVNNIIL